MKDYTGHQALSVTGPLKQNNIDFLTASKAHHDEYFLLISW